MSLVKINWHPDAKQLRGFGIISLIASIVVSILLHLLKGLGIQYSLLIFTVGLFIFIVSLVSTRLSRLIYLALILATVPIGLVVSFLVMAAFYFLLLTPIGLIFRLIGRDPLRRKFDPDARSYWVTHCQPDRSDRYFHQF